MFGIVQTLSLVVCEDAADAVAKGFDYKNKGIKSIHITKAVIVKKGMESGASTVDLHLVDEEGTDYVVMVTGNILKAVAQVCE